MDKKKQIMFNLNNFLLSTSLALDFLQKEKINVSSNHHKRVAFIALNIASKYNLNPELLSDLCSLCLAYELDNEDLNKLPFIKKDEILNNETIKELVSFSSQIDKSFSTDKNYVENKISIEEFVCKNKNNFSKELIESFQVISSSISFYLDLENENDILMFIYSSLHDFSSPLNFEDLLNISSIFLKIQNPNSKLIGYSQNISEFYNFDHKDTYTFTIAASLCQIGKLMISKDILEKKESLSSVEFELIKAYPYYTKKILTNIMGFNDIASWAIKVQERLDGSGYSFGFDGKNLSLKDRVLQTLIAYHSLKEEKVYRRSFCHDEAINILQKEASDGKFDLAIIEDLKTVFKES
jgi:HD-GYP domain-containing protein (c-di-GMP phosphodiesterase class II)